MTSCPGCQNPLSNPEQPCPYCAHPPAPLPASPTPVPDAPSTLPAGAAGGEAWVEVPVYTSPIEANGEDTARFSSVQPVWQFVLLQICTFGLYDLVWFYRNWKLIKDRKGWYITPAARALFALFWIRSYCHEIFTLAEPAGHKTRWSPEILGTLFVVCAFMGRAMDRSDEPVAAVFGLLFFLAQVFVMVPVVKALNIYWRHQQPHLPERKYPSAGALVVFFIGGLFWMVLIAGMLIPDHYWNPSVAEP